MKINTTGKKLVNGHNLFFHERRVRYPSFLTIGCTIYESLSTRRGQRGNSCVISTTIAFNLKEDSVRLPRRPKLI